MSDDPAPSRSSRHHIMALENAGKPRRPPVDELNRRQSLNQRRAPHKTPIGLPMRASIKTFTCYEPAFEGPRWPVTVSQHRASS